MTFQRNSAVVNRLFNSEQCPHCRDIKPSGRPFCQGCMDKLPSDLQYELTNSPDPILKNLAFADATNFLQGEFR